MRKEGIEGVGLRKVREGEWHKGKSSLCLCVRDSVSLYLLHHSKL